MPRIEQDALTDSLVAADARGHHSHGVRALPAKYYPEIQGDKIRPAAAPDRHTTGSFSGLVEGNLAFGQLAARHATDLAVENAAEHGIGVVGIDGVSHIGRVGEWVELAVAHDMLFAAFVCNPGSHVRRARGERATPALHQPHRVRRPHLRCPPLPARTRHRY